MNSIAKSVFLVIGSGLLGTGVVNHTFHNKSQNLMTLLSLRQTTNDAKASTKTVLRNILGDSVATCNSHEDYKALFERINAQIRTHNCANNTSSKGTVLITIPTLPTNELRSLTDLAARQNLNVIYISSPAANGARAGKAQDPYSVTKRDHEDVINKCDDELVHSAESSTFASALQIGFIPQLGCLDMLNSDGGKIGSLPIDSGLSEKTMITCFLIADVKRTGDVVTHSESSSGQILAAVDDENLTEGEITRLRNHVQKVSTDEKWMKAGFTTTPIDAVGRFTTDLATGKLKIPAEIRSETLAMHSPSKWVREAIVSAALDASIVRDAIVPVEPADERFRRYFSDYVVTDEVVANTINGSYRNVYGPHRVHYLKMLIRILREEEEPKAKS